MNEAPRRSPTDAIEDLWNESREKDEVEALTQNPLLRMWLIFFRELKQLFP